MKKARRVTRRTAAEFFSEEVELEEREELHTPQGPVAGRLPEASPEEHHCWVTPPCPGGSSWTSWETLACS